MDIYEFHSGIHCKRWIFLLSFTFMFLVTSCTASTKSVKPPSYGAFVKQNGELIELTQRELLKTPLLGELTDIQKVQGDQPEIILWQQDTRLDYLDFYQLGQTKSQRQRMKYNAKPGDEGIIEITPASPLESGEYCLVQGDPLGMVLPGWCFEISSTSASGTFPTASLIARRNLSSKLRLSLA